MASLKEFLTRLKSRRTKEQQGFSRELLLISHTGFFTFVDPKGDLHNVIQKCRQARIMLLNPYGERANLKKILSPGAISAEIFYEHIKKSLEFLKAVENLKNNIRVKLYPGPPFLQLTILGDYLWIRYYHSSPNRPVTPEYSYRQTPDHGSLYIPFYHYFLAQWNDPRLPEYDLKTDELVYRDGSGKETKRDRVPDFPNGNFSVPQRISI
jgi:hypothetical protein